MTQSTSISLRSLIRSITWTPTLEYRYENAPEDIGTKEQKNHHLLTWICNANCFAALSLVELMIEENSQILEKMDESTRSQFWDRMKKQLLELKSLMSVVKTKCEEMKMKNVSSEVEKSLFARQGIMNSSSILDDIAESIDNKKSKKSPTDAAFTKKLDTLKDKLLKLPSAESNTKDFHSLVLQIDTGRHFEDELVKKSGFRFYAKDDHTHTDDGGMVYLQRREHFEETEREEQHHRSKSVLLSGSKLKLHKMGSSPSNVRVEDLDEKIDDDDDDGKKTLKDDLKSIHMNMDVDAKISVPGPPSLSKVPRPPESPDSSREEAVI